MALAVCRMAGVAAVCAMINGFSVNDFFWVKEGMARTCFLPNGVTSPQNSTNLLIFASPKLFLLVWWKGSCVVSPCRFAGRGENICFLFLNTSVR